MIQWDLSLEWLNICKSISVIHHIKKMKQNSHNHLNCYRKCIWQNSASIHGKNSYKLGREGTYLNKDLYDQPRANIIFNDEGLKASSLPSGTRQWCPPFHSYSTWYLHQATKQVNKRYQQTTTDKQQGPTYSVWNYIQYLAINYNGKEW